MGDSRAKRLHIFWAVLMVFGFLITGCQTTAAMRTPATDSGGDVGGGRAVPANFRDWLAAVRAEAVAQGIRTQTVEAALKSVQINDKVLALDNQQPEFTRTVWHYLDTAISERRVRIGQERQGTHQVLLRNIKNKYGVDSEVLIAFWGIETDFGQYMGGFSVIESLVTLAYAGRRPDMFRSELLAALRILDSGVITRARMEGSWAGAMGQTQFMPSVYLQHAVDFNGDGRRDIWHNISDILASTAHFVAESGWQRGQRWGLEVRVPGDFAWSEAELTVRKTVAEWQALGVRGVGGRALTEVMPADASAALLVLAGHSGPVFLVGENFRTIMRYNPSASYALAVALLADRIAGHSSGVVVDWPRHEQPLSRVEIMDLQERLQRRGYLASPPDGRIGPETRNALRRYQVSRNLIADGFASKAILQSLRTE